jgi:hypothetical protein
MLAWMVAPKFTSDAAIRFKSGRRTTEWIKDQSKFGGKTPRPQSLTWSTINSVAPCLSLNRMAASCWCYGFILAFLLFTCCSYVISCDMFCHITWSSDPGRRLFSSLLDLCFC